MTDKNGSVIGGNITFITLLQITFIVLKLRNGITVVYEWKERWRLNDEI